MWLTGAKQGITVSENALIPEASASPVTFGSFGLHSSITQSLLDAGYETPTPIQKDAIPLIMKGKDIIGLAQTGTGKTAAFVLPILNKLLASKRNDSPTVLILTPTRELAEQVGEVVRNFSKGTWIRSICIYGGLSMSRQLRELKKPQHIIIACPGRLLDHVERRTINLGKIETVVLDEADQLHDMGFLPSIKAIVRNLPAERQTLLFSATMPKEIERLISEYLREPQRIQATSLEPSKSIEQVIVPVVSEKKKDLLIKILREISGDESVLVFTRTKHRAKSLDDQLNRAGFAASSLQGNLSQARRASAMNGFRSGKYQILVATDIAARGIDVSLVSHVINFDFPETNEAYTHRIGRTGRASKTGKSYTFVTLEERDGLRSLERSLKLTIERKTFEGFSFDLPAFPLDGGRPSSGGRSYGGGRPGGQRRGNGGGGGRSYGGQKRGNGSSANRPKFGNSRGPRREAPAN